jgi:hypothetical protein
MIDDEKPEFRLIESTWTQASLNQDELNQAMFGNFSDFLLPRKLDEEEKHYLIHSIVLKGLDELSNLPKENI